MAGTTDSLLTDLTTKGAFSGAVLLAQNGQVILRKGYGYADRQTKTPNTSTTRFPIFTMTKSFTAASILLLAERKKLSVQDKICQYFLDCPDTWKDITIHQLLTHTSGIPDIGVNFLPSQAVEQLRNVALKFKPGSQWDYSFNGYILLGLIVEKASGVPYQVFVQQEILAPLGMKDSGEISSQVDLAKLYADQQLNPVTLFDGNDIASVRGAADLFSTVDDLYRWDQALYTEQLLPKQAIDQMFTAYAQVPDVKDLSYGYGWFIGNDRTHAYAQHPGGAQVYTTILRRYPDSKTTIIILLNQGNIDLEDITNRLAALILK